MENVPMTAQRDRSRQGSQDGGTSAGPVPAERLHAVFDTMFDGVWMVAPDGRTTYANAAMASLLGISPDELLARTLTDFLDPALHADAMAFLDRQRTAPGERIEFRFRRADGRELLGMLAASPILSPGGEFVGAMLNFSDVTGKRAYEAQLMQDEKMRAIGEFAGGLAHDFNNLLTAIRGHAELAALEAPPDSPVTDDLAEIIAGTERASLITRSLLAFTKRQVLVPSLIDPAQRVADLTPMLRELAGTEIDVLLTSVPPCDWVVFDPVQFDQVLINLVVNARDAMPDGGRVELAVQNSEPARRERPDAITVPDRNVRITVTDTGHGMDEATRSRVFDPFFTTKGLGRGTGLGLATVFGIVTQSGGAIQVESAPGRGARFIVDLPGAAAPAGDAATPAREVQSGVDAGSARAASGFILLVDDEPAIREIGRRTLERAGYRVQVASSGEDALALVQRAEHPIDVVVSDVVMPGMHGPALIGQVRAHLPDVGVVLMSGYAQDMVERTAPGFDEFLAKPFEPSRLLDVVDRVSRAYAARRKAAGPSGGGAPEDALEPEDLHVEQVQNPTRLMVAGRRAADQTDQPAHAASQTGVAERRSSPVRPGARSRPG